MEDEEEVTENTPRKGNAPTMADKPTTADEAIGTPAAKPRPGAYVAGLVVFRIFNSVYWALVGGLGWGLGAALGALVPWPHAGLVGGAVGLALVLLAVLTIGLGDKRTEPTPIQLVGFGGVAVGSASFLMLAPFSTELNVALGAVMGLGVGVLSSVMKQYFAPVTAVRAGALAVSGAALFVGLLVLIDGPVGWGAAGALSLCCVAFLAECWRREPAVLIGANEQPIGVIPRREMCWHTVKQSWSLRDPVAWGWHGLLAGLLAWLWADWAREKLNTDVVRQPFLVCGGLAALAIVVTRLGIGAGNPTNRVRETGKRQPDVSDTNGHNPTDGR
jgi:hypothetical protein